MLKNESPWVHVNMDYTDFDTYQSTLVSVGSVGHFYDRGYLNIFIICYCRRKILPRMVSHSELRKLFCSADAVCFDVDSTVIREEGIDELAKFCGVEDAVSEM